jgi:2-amino-4-hydroxy-6-hydroxymethyldihydropteridine diphosphokinase
MATKLKKIYLLIGSNMGERKQYLNQAKDLIQKNIGKIRKQSRLYETQAWGNTNQPDFLNQALLVDTPQLPHDILKNILKIETEMGRVRTEKWAERLIDIDILLIDNQVINTKDLTVPHPQLHERNFALIPLMEIGGDVEHPVFNKTIDEVYDACKDPLDVFLVEN